MRVSVGGERGEVKRRGAETPTAHSRRSSFAPSEPAVRVARARSVLKAPGGLRTIRSGSSALTSWRGASTLEVDRISAERCLLFRHSVSSLRRLGCGGPGPAPPDLAEGIMYALRGREKRKILSVGAPHEGKTTGWGYGTRRGLRPPFRNLPPPGFVA